MWGGLHKQRNRNSRNTKLFFFAHHEQQYEEPQEAGEGEEQHGPSRPHLQRHQPVREPRHLSHEALREGILLATYYINIGNTEVKMSGMLLEESVDIRRKV